MGTAYVVQQVNGRNYNPARATHPHIQSIFHPASQLWGMEPTNDYVCQANTVLDEFDPLQDAVIPTGDPLLIGLVFAWLYVHVGAFTCLKWDRQTGTYVEIHMEMDLE